MLNRTTHSASSAWQAAKGLLDHTARRTHDPVQKMQILAVKIARIETRLNENDYSTDGLRDSAVRHRHHKQERLLKALQKYRGLNKAEAALTTQSLISDYKAILNNKAKLNPGASIQTTAAARQTALDFALKKPQSLEQTASTLMNLVTDSSSLHNIRRSINTSPTWRGNTEIIPAMQNIAVHILHTENKLKPELRTALENFAEPIIKEKNNKEQYVTNLVKDFIGGHFNLETMKDCIDASKDSDIIRNMVIAELKEKADALWRNGHKDRSLAMHTHIAFLKNK